MLSSFSLLLPYCLFWRPICFCFCLWYTRNTLHFFCYHYHSLHLSLGVTWDSLCSEWDGTIKKSQLWAPSGDAEGNSAYWQSIELAKEETKGGSFYKRHNRWSMKNILCFWKLKPWNVFKDWSKLWIRSWSFAPKTLIPRFNRRLWNG